MQIADLLNQKPWSGAICVLTRTPADSAGCSSLGGTDPEESVVLTRPGVSAGVGIREPRRYSEDLRGPAISRSSDVKNDRGDDDGGSGKDEDGDQGQDPATENHLLSKYYFGTAHSVLTYEVNVVIALILQMNRLRHRKVLVLVHVTQLARSAFFQSPQCRHQQVI